MKTRLIILVLLIVCYSCGTSNKPLSDAQKEKIKGEVKEIVKTFLKGAEEANFDMAMTPWLDSPDFVYIYNGVCFDYKSIVDVLKPSFSKMINQKVSIKDEKYAFLDKSTVIYTSNCTFLENYKDGHAVLEDPAVIQITFKKISDKWMAICGLESSVRQDVKNSETSKALNQVELLKQWLGTWQTSVNKDTIELWEGKPYGKALIITVSQVIKGKKTDSYVAICGYDDRDDKIKGYNISPNTDFVTWTGNFTTDKKFNADALDTFKPEIVWWKNEIESKTPSELVVRAFNTQGVKTGEWTYKKIK